LAEVQQTNKFLIFAPSIIVSPKSNTMDIASIIIFLLIGAVAGWLAGKLMKGGGFGLIVNIIVGIIGGFIGGWLMSLVGIEKGGLVWEIITSVIGACVLLFIIALFKRK
jgi:uncharacterized membrane protein YeaQ/YmgE (transglycosylase-associated protein family)